MPLNANLVPQSIPFMTERTRAILEGRGERADLMNYNGKPYRSKSLKAGAQEDAFKCDDGAYRTNTPVRYHPRPK